jgi:hypothetical protein
MKYLKIFETKSLKVELAKTDEEAYQQGWDEYYNNSNGNVNPYPKDSKLAKAWDSGNKDAFDDEHTNEGESPSSDAEKGLAEIKQEIYIEAKKQYMNAIYDSLEDFGFKDIKMDMSTDVLDFATDKFTCTFKGKKIKLTMSHSGNSIAAEGNDIPQLRGKYSTKIKTLLKKVVKILGQNDK